MAKLALVLIFAGLCFKIAAVPFHFYAPDVYQGTTHPNAALLSVIPKAAGLVAMVRLLVFAMPGMEPYSWRIALALAVLTMTFGNVMALWQDNLRRLLAYSSIAHAGYMLIGLAVGLAVPCRAGAWDGLGGDVVLPAVYAVATIGAFAALEHLGPARPARRRRRRTGRAWAHSPPGGRPCWPCSCSVWRAFRRWPASGANCSIFGSALNVGIAGGDSQQHLWLWFLGLAIVGVLNAAVAAAYYLRIVAVMYFRAPLATPRAEGGRGPWLTALACALIVLGIGFYPGPLMRESDLAGIRRSADQLAPRDLAPQR